MPLKFSQSVKITNRTNAYTNAKKAFSYCRRGIAAPVGPDNAVIREIRMLEAAELSMQRSHNRSERDPVSGNFTWAAADSGGSKLMKDYEGISGGYRVLQAQHGD